VLLDALLTNKDLEQVYCCNELNCGYSAEGYARAHGAAAAVVTFSVGALSAINAVAGAYAENLPVILVSGAPNTNDRATEHLLHHTRNPRFLLSAGNREEDHLRCCCRNVADRLAGPD
jgi:pyruvate decarboxylase